MSIENDFERLIGEATAKIKAAAQEAIEKVYTDLLPHVAEDTEYNCQYRANEIVCRLMNGDFLVDDDGNIIIDGNRIKTLSSFNYDKLVDVLADKCSDIAAKQKIKRLESALNDAYNNGY